MPHTFSRSVQILGFDARSCWLTHPRHATLWRNRLGRSAPRWWENGVSGSNMAIIQVPRPPGVSETSLSGHGPHCIHPAGWMHAWCFCHAHGRQCQHAHTLFICIACHPSISKSLNKYGPRRTDWLGETTSMHDLLAIA